ncbi:hypothetical protein KCU91_g24, partial [Aureobasidium melanogenum]
MRTNESIQKEKTDLHSQGDRLQHKKENNRQTHQNLTTSFSKQQETPFSTQEQKEEGRVFGEDEEFRRLNTQGIHTFSLSFAFLSITSGIVINRQQQNTTQEVDLSILFSLTSSNNNLLRDLTAEITFKHGSSLYQRFQKDFLSTLRLRASNSYGFLLDALVTNVALAMNPLKFIVWSGMIGVAFDRDYIEDTVCWVMVRADVVDQISRKR